MSQVLAKIMASELSYNETNKKKFHSQAKKELKAIAKSMGLNPEDYEIRSNAGGIAVSGEVTLHSKWFYVQVSEMMGRPNVLYRTCNGMKDYSGGMNQYADVESLGSPQFEGRLRKMMG